MKLLGFFKGNCGVKDDHFYHPNVLVIPHLSMVSTNIYPIAELQQEIVLMKGLATVISDQFQGCYNDSGTVACNTCTTVITHIYNGNGIYVTYTMLKGRRGYHLYPHLSMVYPVNNFGRTEDVPKALSRSRLLCSLLYTHSVHEIHGDSFDDSCQVPNLGQKDIIGSSQRRQFSKCKWSRCL